MKEVKLYNSLTNKLEVFKPIKDGEVSIYVCGPTVYNSPHVGNIRPPVVFDLLRRLFIALGYKVNFVSNFTDVDDKIINRAVEEKVSEILISNKYIEEYKALLSDLNCLPATVNPRVTEYMDKIIQYIKELVELDAAYVVDGDVYFSVDSIENYGELSNINIEDLKVGARIEENSKKRNPLDFALWKKTSIGIAWDTEWSKGRPGWHTECCVMINSIFPEHIIDIHGGGFDLKFPHHENEIAQSKAHNKNKLANYWMHNGFININNEKMSKSLGNVILARDLISKCGGNVIRWLMLSAPYRSPLNFTEESLEFAKNELTKIEIPYRQLAVKLQLNHIDLYQNVDINIDKFLDSLCDDLNVANAVSELFGVVKTINQGLRNPNVSNDEMLRNFASLNAMFAVLGIRFEFPILSNDDIEIYNKYLALKKEKKFEESDKLRAVLIERKIL